MAVYYINGTSNSGATFGTSGYFYPLYLTATEANSASANSPTPGTSHAHTFEEAPNITFYMPTTGATHAAATAPSGSYSGELYISYTSPIAEEDVEEIGTGVLAGDTFNSWRKKTNDVARETIANKASIGSVDTRLTRLISVTGGEENIMTLSSSDNITGEKEFEGLVKFTAADDLANAVQVGTDGKIYVSSSKFFFDKDVDLHEAGAEIKASNLDLPTGKTKYAGIQYTWPTTPPVAGQILKVSSGNTLNWATEAAAEATVEAFLIEDPNPIGSILQWSTNTAPSKWLICDGRAVSRTTYDDLHGVIGETYGAGDGSTTFNLPDLRARVPIGKGTNTDANNLSAAFETLGSTTYVANSATIGGEYQHTLTENETPSHRHFVASYDNTTAGDIGPTNHVTRLYSYGMGGAQTPTNPNFEYWLHGSTVEPTVGLSSSVGNDEAHNIVQPFIVLNYIIKAEGSTIVEQNVKPSDGILINDEAALTNLLAAGSENTIKMDVDSNDFEFNGNTLKLVDTNYRSGEIIETFGGPCDGRSVTVVSGTHTLPDVNNIVGSNGTQLLEGCKMNYTPPAGTKYVRLEMTFISENLNSDGIGYFYPSISTESDTVLIPSKYYSATRIDVSTSSRNQIPLAATYTIDSTIDSENDSSIYNQMLKSWTTSRAIGFTFNAHSTSYDVRLFEDHNQTTAPGSIDDEFDTRAAASLVEPHITITAIAG